MRCKLCGSIMSTTLILTNGNPVYVCDRPIRRMGSQFEDGKLVIKTDPRSSPCGNYQNHKGEIIPNGTFVAYRTSKEVQTEKIRRE